LAGAISAGLVLAFGAGAAAAATLPDFDIRESRASATVRAGRTVTLRVTGQRRALERLPRGRLVPASIVIQPDRASRAAGARRRVQQTYVSRFGVARKRSSGGLVAGRARP
jgi:hypothetical protein